MDKRLFRMGLVIGVVMLFIGSVIGQSTVNIGEKCLSKDAMKFCETYKSGNDKPIIINPYPKDGSENIPLAGTPINVEIYDDDNDKMKSEIWSNFTGKWVKYAGWDLSDDYITQFLVDYNGDDKWDNVDRNHYISNEGNLESGRYGFFENRSVTMNWKMTLSGTRYYWSVNVTDGTGWTNNTYHFTTERITIYVDDNYDNSTPGWNYTHFNKIQAGIDVAEEGNIVFVYSGIYKENILLDKSLRLIGETRESTVILGKERETDDDQEDFVVKIIANNSMLDGFSIEGNGYDEKGTMRGIYIGGMRNLILRNEVSNCLYGIYASGYEFDPKVRNNFIYENKISNCKKSGIFIENSNDNTVSLNTIENIICMKEWGAIHLKDTHSNNVVDNKIMNNVQVGININGGKSQYNVINHNHLDCTQTCLILRNAGDRNLVTTNDFCYAGTSSPKYGTVYIEDTDDIKIIGNYYEDQKIKGFRIRRIPVYMHFAGIPYTRFISLFDLKVSPVPLYIW